MTAIPCPIRFTGAGRVVRNPLGGFRNYYRYAALGVQPCQLMQGTIHCPAGAAIDDGDSINLAHPVTGVLTVFEFDSGGGVAPGSVPIAFTGAETDAEIAALVWPVIEGYVPGGFDAWLAAPGGHVVAFRAHQPGINNIAYATDVDIVVTITRQGYRGMNLTPIRWGLKRGFAPDGLKLS